MAKTITAASIVEGLTLAAQNQPLPYFTAIDGRWSPTPLEQSAAIVPALDALIERELAAAKEQGHTFDPNIKPLELLLHPVAVYTHPTVARWLTAIAQAANKDRFR